MIKDSINYWWMNTNPEDWRVLEYPEGYDDTELTHRPDGKRRAVFSNFKKVRPGDLMIGYETSPTRKVLVLYKATKGLHNDLKEGECIRFRIERFVNKPLSWDDIKVHPLLRNSLMVRVNNRGSLFSLTSEEYHTIVELVL